MAETTSRGGDLHLRKFTVISRGDERSNTARAAIKLQLEKLGMMYDDEKPELVITVGGDGTMLYAFHRFKSMLDQVAFVGIHTGHLGFYADWMVDESIFLALSISEGPISVVAYPLLDVEIVYKDSKLPTKYLAMNESTIRGIGGSTLVVDVELNGYYFECFRGDGLCFSTPSGSTAYNKALGGAIVHPSIEVMQMTEMASINNKIYRTISSPLILPKHHHCILQPSHQDEFSVTIDHLSFLHSQVKSISYCVSDKKVRFARLRSFPFWKRVKDSFIDEK